MSEVEIVAVTRQYVFKRVITIIAFVCIICIDVQRVGKWALVFLFREDEAFAQEEPLLVGGTGWYRRKDMGSRVDWVLMLSLLVLFALHPGRACVTPQISVRPQITCIMLSLDSEQWALLFSQSLTCSSEKLY